MIKLEIENDFYESAKIDIVAKGYKFKPSTGVATVTEKTVSACLSPPAPTVINPPEDPGVFIADDALEVRAKMNGEYLFGETYKPLTAIATDFESKDVLFTNQELPVPPPVFYFSKATNQQWENLITSASMENLKNNFKYSVIDFAFGAGNSLIYKPSYLDMNVIDVQEVPGSDCINYRGKKVPVFISMMNDSNLYFIMKYAAMNTKTVVDVKITDSNDVIIGGGYFYLRNYNTDVGRKGNPLPTFLAGTTITYVQYVDYLPSDGKMYIETTVTDGSSPFAEVIGTTNKVEYTYTVEPLDNIEGA